MPGTGQTFTIQITNKSGRLQNFYLVHEKPELPDVDPWKVFTNIYGVAPGIKDNETASFEINPNYSAICGVSTKKIQQGMIISDISAKPVVLGASKTARDASCWGVTVPHHQHPEWTDESKITAVGGFRISTDGSWAPGSNLFVGVGSDDLTGGSKQVPITTVTSDPSLDYTFTMKKVYYIGIGDFQQGELVDVSGGGIFYKVDTAVDPEPVKKYLFLKDGTFEPDE